MGYRTSERNKERVHGQLGRESERERKAKRAIRESQYLTYPWNRLFAFLCRWNESLATGDRSDFGRRPAPCQMVQYSRR